MKQTLLTTLFLSVFLVQPVLADNDHRFNIPPDLERALQTALERLAREQDKKDGSWHQKKYSSFGKNVGITSLVLMAFMSMGNLPGEGKYGDVVAKGLNWTLDQVQSNGLIESKEGKGPVMYGHGLATLMLSEVWGQTRRKDVGNALRKAVQLIVQIQGTRGGWNYRSVPRDGDTSVCVIQMFALQSAFEAGMHVPGSTINKALKLIKGRYDAKGKGYGYSDSGHLDFSHYGSSVAGICIMQICGVKDKKLVEDPIPELLKQVKNGRHKRTQNLPYFYYYGSVCVFKAGQDKNGKYYYDEWQKMISPEIIKSLVDDKSHHGTAFNILAAALPYRYIPIYQN